MFFLLDAFYAEVFADFISQNIANLIVPGNG